MISAWSADSCRLSRANFSFSHLCERNIPFWIWLRWHGQWCSSLKSLKLIDSPLPVSLPFVCVSSHFSVGEMRTKFSDSWESQKYFPFIIWFIDSTLKKWTKTSSLSSSLNLSWLITNALEASRKQRWYIFSWTCICGCFVKIACCIIFCTFVSKQKNTDGEKGSPLV